MKLPTSILLCESIALNIHYIFVRNNYLIEIYFYAPKKLEDALLFLATNDIYDILLHI